MTHEVRKYRVQLPTTIRPRFSILAARSKSRRLIRTRRRLRCGESSYRPQPCPMRRSLRHCAVCPPPTIGRRTISFKATIAQVVALANIGAANETDPRQLAVELEKFVKQAVTLKNFSQAFDTAAEVARQPEGDCTEHAVLLAGLGSCPRHSCPRGDWLGLPGQHAELRLPHVERTVAHRPLGADGCHTGPRRHRRRPSQAQPIPISPAHKPTVASCRWRR